MKVGDFWEYAVRDAYTGFDRGLFRYTVSHVEPDRIVADVTRNGERVDSYVYGPGWNEIEHPLTNLQRFRFQPAFPAYDYPLVPGKTWYTVVNATDPVTRQTYRVHTQGKVVGWERIRVPEGYSLEFVGRFPGQPMQIVYGPDARLYATVLENGATRTGAVYVLNADGTSERYSGDPARRSSMEGARTSYRPK